MSLVTLIFLIFKFPWKIIDGLKKKEKSKTSEKNLEKI